MLIVCDSVVFEVGIDVNVMKCLMFGFMYSG